jgi:prevent-host-death family protein
MRTVPAGEFKAKCLAILDEVNETGEPVLITKRGKPVARVTTIEEADQRKTDAESIFGALKGLISVVGDPGDLVDPIVPLEDWDMLKDDWNLLPPDK